LFEHPEWQKLLFSALERRQVRFGVCDLKRAAFDPDRTAIRAPLALSLMRSPELGGDAAIAIADEFRTTFRAGPITMVAALSASIARSSSRKGAVVAALEYRCDNQHPQTI
jgi:hypothetical protein